MDPESLLVSTDSQRPLRVSRQAITQLEVSTARHGHARTGLLIGAGVGAVFGAVIPLDAGCTQAQIEVDDPSCRTSRAGMIALATVSEAAFGALIGHLIKSDTWSSVQPGRVRFSLVPARGRGGRLSASVSW